MSAKRKWSFEPRCKTWLQRDGKAVFARAMRWLTG